MGPAAPTVLKQGERTSPEQHGSSPRNPWCSTFCGLSPPLQRCCTAQPSATHLARQRVPRQSRGATRLQSLVRSTAHDNATPTRLFRSPTSGGSQTPPSLARARTSASSTRTGARRAPSSKSAPQPRSSTGSQSSGTSIPRTSSHWLPSVTLRAPLPPRPTSTATPTGLPPT